MQQRIANALASLLFIAACDEWHRPPSGASSASPSAPAANASDDGDLAPAIELRAPKPRYALAALSEKQLAKLVTRANFTPTVVGKSPPGEGSSTIRVAGFRKSGGQQLEAIVIVRC